MTGANKKNEAVAMWFIPLCLYGNILCNMVAILFGVSADSFLRRVIVYGALFLTTVFLYWSADYKLIPCEIFALILWGGVCVARVSALYEGNLRLFVINESGGLFLGMVFFAGVFCCATKLQRTIVPIKVYLLVVGLLATIYLFYLCTGGNGTTFFEWMDYLSISSLFLHFLLILFFGIERVALKKVEKCVCYFLLLFIVGAIVCTDCKRDILSLYFLMLVILVKCIAGKKREFLALVVCVVSTIFFSWVGENIDNRRRGLEEEMLLFQKYLTDATDATITPDFVYEEKGPQIIGLTMKWAQDVYGEIEEVKAIHAEYEGRSYAKILADYVLYSDKMIRDLEEGIIDKELYSNIIVNFRFMNNTSIGARMYLYGNCLYEFLESPVMGNGIMSYQGKYNTYAHCIPLEVMADFGMMGILLMVIWVVVCGRMLICLITGNVNDAWIEFLLFYVLCTLPRDIFGGDLYSYMSVFKYLLLFFLCVKRIRIKKI